MNSDTDYNLNQTNGPQRGGNHLVSVHRLREARFLRVEKCYYVSSCQCQITVRGTVNGRAKEGHI